MPNIPKPDAPTRGDVAVIGAHAFAFAVGCSAIYAEPGTTEVLVSDVMTGEEVLDFFTGIKTWDDLKRAARRTCELILKTLEE